MSTANEIAPPQVRWNLNALFSSMDDPKIEQTWAEVQRRADEFDAKYRGKLASLDSNELLAAIAELEDLYMQMAKPGSFASLMFAVEADNPEITAFMQAQSEKESEVQVKLIFCNLELQAIPKDKFDALLADPILAKYHHFLQRVREATPFMLTEKEEVILEETANTGIRAWVRLHDEVLANKQFEFVNPKTGETELMSESAILAKLRDANRDVRSAAADGFSKGLQELNHVLTYIYNNVLLDKRVEDKLRTRPYAEHSRHMANELDKETVDLVMRLCKKNEELVARYYRVKRQILGLPELTHIDRYAPLFESEEQIDWDSARKMVLDAFNAFSPEIGARASEFFDKGWIDAEPRQGKTGGAFCSYITPDLHPVIMLSYLNKMDNVMTLAHELGHGVHASLSRAQSYFNFHGSLPLAELASIFGEQLVFERLVSEAQTNDQLALYAEKIEGIFASVFRQAAMFRFEQKCHEMRRTEGELSGEEFGELWQEELQGMFGDSVKMEPQHKDWWSYIGHFIFAPFYVYAYSFGELLTMSLYQMAAKEGPSFQDKYIQMLTLGGSKSPKELMEIVGVDLRQEEFWNGGFAVIESLITRFEELWAQKSN